jgi:hypothetical protein
MSHKTGWEHPVQNRKGQLKYQELTSSKANNTPSTRALKSYYNTSYMATSHMYPTNSLCSFLSHKIPNMVLNLIPYFIMSF